MSVQDRLFDVPAEWEQLWEDMPEFVQEDLTPVDTVKVQFRSDEDRQDFLRTLGYEPFRRRSIWWPHKARARMSQASDAKAQIPQGKYPIYVISKGRSQAQTFYGGHIFQTTRVLDDLGLPYSLVVERQEKHAYAEELGRDDHILTLPCPNDEGCSVPARNWVWDHALKSGAKRHWILDDNIEGFYRLNRNRKTKIRDENPFVPCERFVDRFENVGLAGLQYESFAPRREAMPPFRLNTRIYSCILINHDLHQLRWRGRYNEDTDLSLRVLKAGWVTVLFNAYLCNKAPTMRMNGGNTEELYADGGRLEMAESLRDQHPDVVTITEKWGRPQHHVDYSPFKDNKLVPK